MKTWLQRLFRLGLAMAAMLLLAWYGLPWLAPLPASLQVPSSPGSRYLASDGTPLRHTLNEAGQRTGPPVSLDHIPETMIHAALAAEDKRFYRHDGIDVLAVARSAWMNARSGHVLSGASTITQQLVKFSRGTPPRTFREKVREALMARHLEMTWTKRQILEAYLNRVNFGNLFTGVEAAADGYFHKPLRDLTPAECAFLAALPQAPGRLNPFNKPDAVAQRSREVLKRMLDLDWLNLEDFHIALEQPLPLKRFRGGFMAPHAVDLLEADRAQKPPVIRTTIVPELQSQVETLVAQKLEGLRSKRVEHAAAVVIDNATGRVLALVGSRDYFAGNGGQINGAWAPHSPGSALKPFTYALAFEHGATPASIAMDLPIEFQTDTGLYRPENYDHKSYGPMTYRYALGNSLNVSAVRVLNSLGGASVLLDKLQTLGITTLTESADHYGLGLTIGNAPVRLLELTNAYASLARLGLFRPWTLVLDGPPVPPVRIISEQSAWWIADILSDNQARALTFGLHSPLRLPFKVAAKTGTSTSYRDNWALGYTPEYTVGVWAGNFEGKPMERISGVTGAGPVFHDIFLYLQKNHKLTWYDTPKDLARRKFDPRTGRLLGAHSPSVRLSREDWFVAGAEPPKANAADYDENGRAILPHDFAAWISSQDNWLGDLVTTPDVKTGPLHITQPAAGLTILLDPDLPGTQKLLLQAVPAGASWSCATLKLEHTGPQWFAVLAPGEHRLAAHADGHSTEATIRVVR